MCSHIPKIGGNAPVTLRYSDHECRRCIQDFPVRECFFPVLGYYKREVDHKGAARRVRNDVTPLRGESVGGLPRHPRKRSKKTLLEDPRILLVCLWARSKPAAALYL